MILSIASAIAGAYIRKPGLWLAGRVFLLFGYFLFRSRIIAMMQEVPLKRDPNTAVEPMMV